MTLFGCGDSRVREWDSEGFYNNVHKQFRNDGRDEVTILGEWDEEWNLYDCGTPLEYCPDCDNEVCSECGSGCACDEIDEDYDDDDWETEDY